MTVYYLIIISKLRGANIKRFLYKCKCVYFYFLFWKTNVVILLKIWLHPTSARHLITVGLNNCRLIQSASIAPAERKYLFQFFYIL
ncbi:hypothetical protein DU508_00165 [Pedobacter chinensis]|uniref:Uncharacterized protein n=1 Tax=Pedobacter chinensis TaxID=2282421 RepID=A0A369Q599_9SPHI|nr:hypothetical protein DU508_00165 [Pedobacter chinensis]